MATIEARHVYSLSGRGIVVIAAAAAAAACVC